MTWLTVPSSRLRSATVRELAALIFARDCCGAASGRVNQVSGSTLRHFLGHCAETAVLAKVHAMLVAMLRVNPTLILDSGSVRAKRGGDLTGPNSIDRARRGTKYHPAVDGNGTSVACLALAANVHDMRVFERLFLGAYASMARIRTMFADKTYDAERPRTLCRAFDAKPLIHKRGPPHGCVLDTVLAG